MSSPISSERGLLFSVARRPSLMAFAMVMVVISGPPCLSRLSCLGGGLSSSANPALYSSNQASSSATSGWAST